MADEDAAVQYAASQPNVCVVSMSYSSSSSGEFADEYAYDSLYTTPVGHQGVAFVAASGDDGALRPDYQQASPNVIVVGGTTLPADQNGNPVRSQEVGWSYGSDTYDVVTSPAAAASVNTRPSRPTSRASSRKARPTAPTPTSPSTPIPSPASPFTTR